MCIAHKRELKRKGRPPVFIDACIYDIVKALNDNGVETIASCCGHFNRWGNIVLSDGRELIIAPDYESARAFDKIHGRNIHDERRELT